MHNIFRTQAFPTFYNIIFTASSYVYNIWAHLLILPIGFYCYRPVRIYMFVVTPLSLYPVPFKSNSWFETQGTPDNTFTQSFEDCMSTGKCIRYNKTTSKPFWVTGCFAFPCICVCDQRKPSFERHNLVSDWISHTAWSWYRKNIKRSIIFYHPVRSASQLHYRQVDISLHIGSSLRRNICDAWDPPWIIGWVTVTYPLLGLVLMDKSSPKKKI